MTLFGGFEARLEDAGSIVVDGWLMGMHTLLPITLKPPIVVGTERDFPESAVLLAKTGDGRDTMTTWFGWRFDIIVDGKLLLFELSVIKLKGSQFTTNSSTLLLLFCLFVASEIGASLFFSRSEFFFINSSDSFKLSIDCFLSSDSLAFLGE